MSLTRKLLPVLTFATLGAVAAACSALTGLSSYAKSDCSEGCGDPNSDAGPPDRTMTFPDAGPPAIGHDAGGQPSAGELGEPGDAGAADDGGEGDGHCAVGDDASCSLRTCAGCRGADGLCVVSAADDACGLEGTRCQDCASIGEMCVAGACAPPSGDSGHLEQRICNNVSICNAQCKDDCLLDCTSADTCLGVCGAGCSYTCIKATNCLPTVGDRSVVTCASSGTCDPTCTGACVVHCASVGQCHVSCADGGAPTACEGGAGWACGQGC